MDDAMDKVLDAMAAHGRNLDGTPRAPVTYAEFEKIVNETPLFMRETPTGGDGDNYVLEALKTLAVEGDSDEVALNFKNHGNELYGRKSFKEAAATYTQGLDAKPRDSALLTTLLNNRAAANLMLKKYRAVLSDTSAVIAQAATDDDPAKRDPPPKTLYRAAQALVGLEKWDEAADAVARGRKLPGEDTKPWWGTLAEQVEKGQRAAAERKERQRRTTLTDGALKLAAVSRGLVVENTSAPPDNPHPLHFDPSSSEDVPLFPPEKAEAWIPPAPEYTPLIYPVFLLYPQYNQSDFITHFHEDTSFDQQLEPIFPASPSAASPPWSDWDQKREYYASNLNVYVETANMRLLKVGKEITLREVIAKAAQAPKDGKPRDGVVLRDGLLSFIILVRGREEREWIDNFKRVRDTKK